MQGHWGKSPLFFGERYDVYWFSASNIYNNTVTFLIFMLVIPYFSRNFVANTASGVVRSAQKFSVLWTELWILFR